MKHILKFYMIVASMLFIQAAYAENPSVISKLTANRVEVIAGKEVLKAATQVKPGDVIEYKTVYTNVGKAAVNQVVATLPIPLGTGLLAGSAKPANALASLDGINFRPVPLMHDVKLQDNTVKKEPVPLIEYRALRWELGAIGPNKNAEVSLRTQVTPALGSTSVKPKNNQ